MICKLVKTYRKLLGSVAKVPLVKMQHDETMQDLQREGKTQREIAAIVNVVQSTVLRALGNYAKSHDGQMHNETNTHDAQMFQDENLVDTLDKKSHDGQIYQDGNFVGHDKKTHDA